MLFVRVRDTVLNRDYRRRTRGAARWSGRVDPIMGLKPIRRIRTCCGAQGDDRSEQCLAVRFEALNDLDAWHSRYVRVKHLSTLE
jgi:hypothetical protein